MVGSFINSQITYYSLPLRQLDPHFWTEYWGRCTRSDVSTYDDTIY